MMETILSFNTEKDYRIWDERPTLAPDQPPAAIASRHPQYPVTCHPYQIQFHAEVQFQIDEAAQLKQERHRQNH